MLASGNKAFVVEANAPTLTLSSSILTRSIGLLAFVLAMLKR